MTLAPVLKLGGEWLDAAAAAKRGLVLSERAGNGARRVALENRSGATVRPEELGWRKEGRCDFDVPGLLFHAEAWQVVGPCGLRRWDDEPFDYSPEYLPNCVSTPGDFRPGERGRFLSDVLCCLRRPDGATRLFGFTTGADRFGHFAAKLGPDGAEEFLALCACDRAELPPGGRIETESLLVLDGADADALLAAFADRWAADSGARRRFAPPVGWCSWYYYFSDVTLADVLENLDWFAARRSDPDFGKVEYIQLDDGWQTALGDWRGSNERFPGGLARFADEAKRRGFTPGVWVAPFAAEEGSAVAAEHPDWLLRDAAGAPVSTMKWRGGRRIFVLDATRPDVLAHLESVFRDIRALGIDYVKLDFCMLECSAPDAVYRDRTATRAQALRRRLRARRHDGLRARRGARRRHARLHGHHAVLGQARAARRSAQRPERLPQRRPPRLHERAPLDQRPRHAHRPRRQHEADAVRSGALGGRGEPRRRLADALRPDGGAPARAPCARPPGACGARLVEEPPPRRPLGTHAPARLGGGEGRPRRPRRLRLRRPPRRGTRPVLTPPARKVDYAVPASGTAVVSNAMNLKQAVRRN